MRVDSCCGGSGETVSSSRGGTGTSAHTALTINYRQLQVLGAHADVTPGAALTLARRMVVL